MLLEYSFKWKKQLIVTNVSDDLISGVKKYANELKDKNYTNEKVLSV